MDGGTNIIGGGQKLALKPDDSIAQSQPKARRTAGATKGARKSAIAQPLKVPQNQQMQRQS